MVDIPLHLLRYPTNCAAVRKSVNDLPSVTMTM